MEADCLTDLEIAVLVPCYNEEATIAAVVASFREQLPTATVYVYDNNSSDKTMEVAEQSGAVVRREKQQGKGHVVRRMFSDIDASIYVLVDGDDTYESERIQSMLETFMRDHCDMLNGRRVTDIAAAYRFGHQFGNRLLTGIVNWIFGKRCDDILSGYRIFSRRFVKSFPALSTGFEIETELTVHALSLNMPIAEVDTQYKDRPEESVSKLNTYRDGLRILWTILILTKDERPFFFYSILFGLMAVTSLALGLPVALEFLDTGLVPRFPTAILAASIMVLAFLSLTTGLVLDSVARGRRESKRLHYLSLSWLGQDRRKS
ncbi:MAG: glycosyltransferase family 2 protein [Woeseiaceae bacterium]